MARTIPKKDEDFDDKQRRIMDKVLPNMDRWKLDKDWIQNQLQPAQKRWETAWKAWKNRITRTITITGEKNSARKNYENLLRIQIAALKSNIYMADFERQDMGIAPKPGGYHGRLSAVDTAPNFHFDTSIAGRITIHVSETGSTSKTFPHEAVAAEIRTAILDHEPQSIDELTAVRTIFQLSEIYDFNIPQQGKALYSIGRWVGPTGKKGPWSRTWRVVIP
jgi:hypothetical protein